MFLLYWSKDTDWVAGLDIKGRYYLIFGEDEYEGEENGTKFEL